MNFLFNKKNKKNGSELDTISKYVIGEKSPFSIAEAYKTLRTNLQFALVDKQGCRKVVVTSASPAEGKSTLAVNLSIVLAQTESKVLLLDCDLRKSRIHRCLKMPNNRGLTDIFNNQCVLKDAIQKSRYNNLDVITSGTIPPNPAELLDSAKMISILDDLSSMYDYIIIDTPPISLVSDALNMAKKCDGILFSIRFNYTTVPQVEKSVKQIEFANINLLGFVLTSVVELRKYRKYYYKRGYYRKYGYYHKRDYKNQENDEN